MKSVKKFKKDIEIRTRWKRIRSYAVELCYACPVHIYMYLEVLAISHTFSSENIPLKFKFAVDMCMIKHWFEKISVVT